MTATQTRPLTVTEAIQTRRSIRKFQPEPISQNDLREILPLRAWRPPRTMCNPLALP